VESLENSELLVINQHDFFHLVATIPEWEKFYRKILELAYLAQNRRLENLVTLTAKQRYENVLKENPIYIQRLSNRILASYLNITQETLSRLKSE
jgi:CRP-like cAMP-binding protein